MIPLLFIILGSHAILCYGARNVTIDNDTGDAETGVLPIYEPFNAWQDASFQPRQGDTNPFNIQGPANVTTTVFSTTTGSSWLTLLFHGTAIYVTFVLTSGPAQYTFVLDDEPLSYMFQFEQTKNFDFYNATIYANSSLTSTPTGSDGAHNLTITTPFAMSFDFAEYTLPDVDATTPSTTSVSASALSTSGSGGVPSITPPGSAPPSSHSALSGGAVAGISIGAFMVLQTLVFFGYRLWNRSHSITRPELDLLQSDPFDIRASRRGSMPSNPTIFNSSSSANHGPPQKPVLQVVNAGTASSTVTTSTSTSDMRSLPTTTVTMDTTALTAEREHLQAQILFQTTSTMALQAQIAYLEDQLRIRSIEHEPPPSY